jgi:PHP family Zn ribbon phosphoesterase
MRIIADLHLHSKYARAVSQEMEVPIIAKWAAIKGISLVGTGDWTHPLWLNELKSQLEEVGEGVYKLKIKNEKLKIEQGKGIGNVRFLLATEISSIYVQGGKQRRIHNLVLAPSFLVVERINNELLGRGCNLNSDGRPIVGLTAKELIELVLGVSDDCLVIPAHIWTPWFSLFGANSGFDSLEECFGDMSDKICAIETGLSCYDEETEVLTDNGWKKFSQVHSSD